jgi:hypothetical protein
MGVGQQSNKADKWQFDSDCQVERDSSVERAFDRCPKGSSRVRSADRETCVVAFGFVHSRFTIETTCRGFGRCWYQRELKGGGRLKTKCQSCCPKVHHCRLKSRRHRRCLSQASKRRGEGFEPLKGYLVVWQSRRVDIARTVCQSRARTAKTEQFDKVDRE